MYAIAFASIWVQIDGLLGSRGILPAADLLARAEQIAPGQWWRVPTLLWLWRTDAALHVLCGAGVGLSALLAVGVAPRPVLIGLWAGYLSLASVGDVFLGYQWDALLLETGAMAVLFAPAGLHPVRAWRRAVSVPGLWLLRWLAFRLFFMAGAVKWLSGDPAWRSLRALDFHYFTQPLPAWTSFHLHHLPSAIHTASVVVTFAVEVGAALLIFAPRRLRLVGCAALATFQFLILASGSYGFFNLLALTLCVALLDDRALRRVLPRALTGWLPPEPVPVRRAERWVVAGIASLAVALSAVQGLARFGVRVPVPGPVSDVLYVGALLRTLNSYGLFAVMTTQRPEIVVEGSADGETWRAYEFRWKPGDPDRRPRFATPHQPRLDWQMWFAALRGCEGAPWFLHFQRRLLDNEPRVLALLETNPFPEAPPRFLRSTVHRYEFAPLGSDAWWQRSRVGPFCADVTLRGGRLSPVPRR